MMKPLLIAAATLLTVAGAVAESPSASIERRFTSVADTHAPGVTLMVDSIDYRTDLTRVYGRIIGRPNTAQRIDTLTLSLPKWVKPMVADDIDGIDFRRWFQWEETGEIPLEIDFGPMKSHPATMLLRAVTPKGAVVWTVKREQ